MLVSQRRGVGRRKPPLAFTEHGRRRHLSAAASASPPISKNTCTHIVAIPMRRIASFYAKMTVLMLTACGASASHAESPVRFLTSGSQDLWPCFSPDGTRILFSRRVAETWELLLVPVVGGQPQQLASSRLPVSATRANWSKQNNLIAFTGTSSRGENRIWVINSDGSNPHELESRGLSDQTFYPSWFPSGEQIAAMDAQDMVIRRVDLNTRVAVTVTDHKRVLTGMPSVSPDGKWIAFAGQENAGQKYDQTKNAIWLVDDGGVPHTVESNPGQGRAPTWSPDGKLLAFESTRGSTIGLYAIFLINRDGTGLRQVTDQVLNADHPVWSPDGRQLAFSARASMWAKGRGIAIIDVPNNR
jgi:Tol biopolymer transport system component